jgi:hypothetical protein
MHNRLYDMIAQNILAAEESTGLKNRERKLKEKEKEQNPNSIYRTNISDRE